MEYSFGHRFQYALSYNQEVPNIVFVFGGTVSPLTVNDTVYGSNVETTLQTSYNLCIFHSVSFEILYQLNVFGLDQLSTKKYFLCSLCSKRFEYSAEYKTHVQNCNDTDSDFQSSGNSSASDNNSNVSDGVSDDEEVVVNAQGQKTIGKDYWKHVHIRKVEQLPTDINGRNVYHLRANNRLVLLEKCRDGRPWKHDSRTKWSGYDTVRYRDCSGGFGCPNPGCEFIKQFGNANKLRFDKNKSCTICGAIGNSVVCPARKYTAFKGQTAHVYHYGRHNCAVNQKSDRPSQAVANALKIDPNVKPSGIQSNAILSDMRSRKTWVEIEKTVKKVTNKKNIANEKIKQRRIMNPKGTGFDALFEYKLFSDEKDKLYIFAIDENKQYVFKTSERKMKMAYEMQNNDHFLCGEYCCFDGKVKRTKDFTTLTASVYHPLLQKQIPH